jgi:hypothetical protein
MIPDDATAMTPGTASRSVMTIGTLARRTGVPVKTLREYEDLGLIYTVGRSAGNYRLFGEEAPARDGGRRPRGGWHAHPGSCQSSVSACLATARSPARNAVAQTRWK